MTAVAPIPPEFTDVRAYALAQLERGVSVARTRLAQVQAMQTDAFPDAALVRRAGGAPLKRLEADLASARTELALVEASARRPLARIAYRVPAFAKALGLVDVEECAARVARLAAERDALHARASRRASEYLRGLKTRERDDAVRKVSVALRRFADLRGGLLAFGGPLPMPRSPALSPAWLAELERALARPVPVVVDEARPAIRPGALPEILTLDRSVLEGSLRSRFQPYAHPIPARPGRRDARWTVADWAIPDAGVVGIRPRGRADLPAPVASAGARTREAFPVLPKAAGRLERCYLPVEAGVGAELGARVGKRGAVAVDLSTVDPSGPVETLLPFIACRRFEPLPVDLIPASSWGGNLANLLAPASWGRIRRGVVGRFGGQCQVCGELKQGQQIECHEVWDYQPPDEGKPHRVQRLAGLLSVCRPCHRMFHIGLGDAGSRGQEAIVRLADVNGWTLRETHDHLDWVQACWEARSEWRWSLDLGLLGGEPLVVDAKRWRVDEDGSLQRLNLADAAEPTWIQGVAWRLGAEGAVVTA